MGCLQHTYHIDLKDNEAMSDQLGMAVVHYVLQLLQSSMHLDIVLQVVGCTLPAAQKVACIEGVVHVPANAAGGTWQVANTKLLALQQCSMEVAKCKDDGAELSLRVAARQQLSTGLSVYCRGDPGDAMLPYSLFPCLGAL